MTKKSKSYRVLPRSTPPAVAKRKAPRVFVSYTHENDNHKRWVKQLARNLRTSHVDVVLDQWDLPEGADVVQFMERGVREADRVLLILTPQYRLRADQRAGGVGYESLVVTGELARDLSTTKFVGLLRSGTLDECVPTFLATRLHVDFRDDEKYGAALEEILRGLFHVPEEPKPAIGEYPFSSDGKVSFSRDIFPPAVAPTSAPGTLGGSSPTPARVDFSFAKLSITSDHHRYSLLASVTLELPPTQREWVLRILWPEEITITRQDSIETARQILVEGLRYKELRLESDRRIWPGETIQALGPDAIAHLEYDFDHPTWSALDDKPRNLLFALYLEDHRPVEGTVPFAGLNCF